VECDLSEHVTRGKESKQYGYTVVREAFSLTHTQGQFSPQHSLKILKHKIFILGVRFWDENKIIILVVNQLDAQNLSYNKFISCLYMFRASCAHHQEVKIVLYSPWYHHTEKSEWSKIT